MKRPRTSGSGRRFELVLMRVRPATPRTVAVIAKHAAPRSYHWLLMTGRRHADPDTLSRLLAVAYLDEASGLLGRGDPRWAVPRAYLRASGDLETTDRPRPDDTGMPSFVARELERIGAWLRARHRPYLEELARALDRGPGEAEGFEPLTPEAARRRGFADPTGRAMLAPDPPPVVTRTPSRAGGDLPGRAREGGDPADRLPWRRWEWERR